MEEEETPQEHLSPKEELRVTVERLEKANAEQRRLHEEAQELAAKNLLGGVTQRQPQAQPPKEDTPREYSTKLLEGKIPLKD